MIRGLDDLTLLIDGVIFQLHQGRSGGISNVWRTLLSSIAENNQFKKVILLDRGGLPSFPGFEVIPFDKFSEDQYDEDTKKLDQVCRDHQVNLFISTYLTTPNKFYAISYLHDFIPEKVGLNLNLTPWLNKAWAIDRASGYIGVSFTTLDDLKLLHPKYNQRKRNLVYNSISDDFKPYPAAQVQATKEKHGIKKKYFLLIGQRLAYKNTLAFFKAFAQLKNQDEFQIVCVGGFERLEYVLRFYLGDFKDIVLLSVDNRELSQLLNGAVAMVYPSIYEGFGMPILEAMASSCPAIIAKQAPACIEVAGNAALVIDGNNVEEMIQAISKVQEPEVRKTLIEAGKVNATRFSTDKTLQQFYTAITHNLSDIQKYYEGKK